MIRTSFGQVPRQEPRLGSHDIWEWEHYQDQEWEHDQDQEWEHDQDQEWDRYQYDM